MTTTTSTKMMMIKENKWNKYANTHEIGSSFNLFLCAHKSAKQKKTSMQWKREYKNNNNSGSSSSTRSNNISHNNGIVAMTLWLFRSFFTHFSYIDMHVRRYILHLFNAIYHSRSRWHVARVSIENVATHRRYNQNEMLNRRKYCGWYDVFTRKTRNSLSHEDATQFEHIDPVCTLPFQS